MSDDGLSGDELEAALEAYMVAIPETVGILSHAVVRALVRQQLETFGYVLGPSYDEDD